jgi:beta-glucosidase-like glycosyl hydrolase
MLRLPSLALAVASAAAWQNNPCLDSTKPYHAQPWCDTSLPIDTRVADMLSRMKMAEKLPVLDTNGPAIESLGLDGYNWWEEASTGVSAGDHTTKFAFPITTGMSFNRTLWQLTGRQIGHEARSLMNAGKAGSSFWAPVINLAREPRWGRNIEVPGEDPYLVGEYAEWFVKGMEQAPEDEGHIQASACCKHYAANSMEHTTEGGQTHTRHDFSATISQQDLVDSYLLPFQACVEKGRVSGLMCSYNAINGVPSCASPWLLDEVARGDWGFDGYITSDCDADADVYRAHHYKNWSKEQVVAGVLKAGTDVDCTSFVGANGQSALDKGLIDEKLIDARLANLFKVRMRLGHFDAKGPLQNFPMTDVCSSYATSLAANGVVQSATLMKNVNGSLPLDPSSVKQVAVVGPTANLSKTSHQDVTYYGPHAPCGGNYWTLADAVTQHSHATANVVLGVPTVLSTNTSAISAAVAAAKEADEVIIAVGTDLTWAHEEHDAQNITFSAAQAQLISMVAAAAKKPVILMVYTATPLDLSEQIANAKIGAIMHLGQPSVNVVGVGELLFGKTSPAGRTVQTVYPASYADEVSIFDFNMRPGPSVFPRPDCKGGCGAVNGTNPGRTFRFYTGQAVVPFGFGLSYSSFKYTPVASVKDGRVSIAPVRAMLAETYAAGHTFPKATYTVGANQPLVSYFVNVTNTGSMDADDVVLGFLVPPGAGTNGIPLKSLFGFERVHVKAGATVTVNLYPALTDFALTSLNGTKWAATGEWAVKFGVQETAKHGQGYAEMKLAAF